MPFRVQKSDGTGTVEFDTALEVRMYLALLADETVEDKDPKMVNVNPAFREGSEVYFARLVEAELRALTEGRDTISPEENLRMFKPGYGA